MWTVFLAEPWREIWLWDRQIISDKPSPCGLSPYLDEVGPDTLVDKTQETLSVEYALSHRWPCQAGTWALARPGLSVVPTWSHHTVGRPAGWVHQYGCIDQ